VADEPDDFDDTPYRESRPNVHPGIFISFDVSEDDYTWVYVDGADTRIARQRFDEVEYLEDGTYERWVGAVFLNLLRDPDGREACGDCGNFLSEHANYHAPDCTHYCWQNPTTS
jgi:hypothetical protein